MARGYKIGSRPSDTPNGKAQAIIYRLDTLGYDPIEGMTRIAMDETTDLINRRDWRSRGLGH
jgi:hypothetical protein